MEQEPFIVDDAVMAGINQGIAERETREAPTIRPLPPEEWDRLRDFPPFAGGLPNPDFNRIIVAELGGPGGEIIGFWMVLTCIHVEPMYVAPAHRKRPSVIRGLWRAVQRTLQSVDARIAFACITDEDAAANVPMAMRLGFRKLSGDLYMIEVPPAPGEVEKE